MLWKHQRGGLVCGKNVNWQGYVAKEGSGKLNLLENCKLLNLYWTKVLERDEML